MVNMVNITTAQQQHVRSTSTVVDSYLFKIILGASPTVVISKPRQIKPKLLKLVLTDNVLVSLLN